MKKINSFGDKSENILIHGDNIDALEQLSESHKNLVKCIYIDPPYNTCNWFEHFDDSLGHDEWIEMMAPRLELMWNLLSEDGTFWISIDDFECHYLKILCDKLWGRDCFLGTIIRQKNDFPRNTTRKIVHMHDYVLVYAKNADKCTIKSIDFANFQKYVISNHDDQNYDWIPENLVKRITENTQHKNNYNIITPAGNIINLSPENEWTIDLDTLMKLRQNNELWFGDNQDEIPVKKRFRIDCELLPPTSMWLEDIAGTNQEARLEVSAFCEDDFFYVPKPERFIKLIIEIATNPNDLVLDAFLGTGTTCAVAHKLGRRWIGIEKGNHCIDYCIPRLKSVLDGEIGGISDVVNWKGSGGFSFFEV